MNLDAHPSMQPANTTREVRNFVQLSKESNLFALTNESGTVHMDKIIFPSGFKVIGYSVLNSDVIVVLAHPSGYSQVGYIREDPSVSNYYTPVAPYNTTTNTVPNNNSELGFSIDHPVDCVSRKLINGHRVLYFTDNHNPFGKVDLENPPEVGSAKSSVKLIFDQKIPKMSLVSIVENIQSTIKPTTYFFVTRYVTGNGGYTSFGLPSEGIPMVPSLRKDGVNKYHGDFYEGAVINKNIVLQFNNVDTKYQELQIVACFYTGAGVFNALIVGNVPITGETVPFTFTGPTTESIAITREEIRATPISYQIAKCIEQKDNTLILTNLRDIEEDGDILQTVANNIQVSYEIEEVAYSNREAGGDPIQAGFTLIGQPVITNSDLSLLLTFSTEVDPTSVAITDFSLKQPRTYASEILTIASYASMFSSNTTITLTNALGVDPVTFTADATDTITDHFIAEIDNATTAINLANVVNSSPNNTNYRAVVTGDDVKFIWIGLPLGNGETLTVSGPGTSGNTSTSGGVIVDTLIAPSAVTVLNNTVTVDFTGSVDFIDPTFSLFVDEIIELVTSGTPGFFGTGVDSSNNVNYISITNESSNSTPVTPDPGFTDYIDERFTFEKKTYRRDETYSLGFYLLYKDGTTSFTYHIPGNNKLETTLGKNPSPAGNNNTGNNSDLLGTYVSTALYPLDQKFPGNDSGDDTLFARSTRNVLHHVMPSLEQEPHFRVSGNSTLVRLLKLNFVFIKVIPDSVLSNVQEVVFVRERRNTSSNRSIYAQGLVNRLVETADHFDVRGHVDPESGSIDGVKANYNLMEMNFFNSLETMVQAAPYFKKGSGSTLKGIAYPGQDLYGGDSYANGKLLNTSIRQDRCMFNSPDTILNTSYKPSTDLLSGGSLKPVLTLLGKAKLILSAGEVWISHVGEDGMRNYKLSDMYCNYKNYDMAGSAVSNTISLSQYIPKNIRRNPALSPETGRIKQVSTRWNQGGLEMKLNSNLAAPTRPYWIQWYNDAGVYDYPSLLFVSKTKTYNDISRLELTNGFVQVPLPLGVEIDIVNYLYNIELANAKQYGEIGLANYINIARFDALDNVGNFRTSCSGAFGGDTFITKFGFNTGNLLMKYPYKRDGGGSINRPIMGGVPCISSRTPQYFNTDNAGPEAAPNSSLNASEGCDFRDLTYLFVESDINTYYRHQLKDSENNLGSDYLPNQSSAVALLYNWLPYLGNAEAYNTFYSYENNIKEFYTKGSTQEIVSIFENRSIYSETASSDTTVDTYRSFLVNNYYDLPSHTGPVWDTFIDNNVLYMHTPKGLWRTFAEPAATLTARDISDVVLGTGSLFARPSREVLTTNGGYGGSISQFGGAHSLIGYIYPDVLQGKLFCLAMGEGGPFLKDLGQSGLTSFFSNNLDLGLTRDALTGTVDMSKVTSDNSHLLDNPFKGIGIAAGYDFELKRYFIVKHGENNFTKTYSILSESWVSNHDYTPNSIISFDRRTLFIDNDNTAQIWEMNKGVKGSYFGSQFNSSISYIVANGPKKTFNNMVINSYSKVRLTDLKIRDNNFKSLKVYTDKQNTGIYSLIDENVSGVVLVEGQTSIKFRNDEYRIAIPRDSIVNNSLSINDVDNMYIPQGGTFAIDSNYGYRERIKGDYAVFELIYDNVLDYEFVLKEIRTIFELNYR